MRGKVGLCIPPRVCHQDHPRVCGEKHNCRRGKMGAQGSPPRMRGKALYGLQTKNETGITPAYAGKSSDHRAVFRFPKDHPRVCGEKGAFTAVSVRGRGSPPRMRGKGTHCKEAGGRLWITPAYAGKRVPGYEQLVRFGDHPRVCGEKPCWKRSSPEITGSPPRMRGKVKQLYVLMMLRGITPAYAGKSFSGRMSANAPRDHPRVCGEKWGGVLKEAARKGSPPRMRGKEFQVVGHTDTPGITPAYAGKSSAQVNVKAVKEDHPRVCGEKGYAFLG